MKLFNHVLLALLSLVGLSLNGQIKIDTAMKSNQSISAEFPFESKYQNVNGHKIHYVEQGEGDPILFLHGNPTSSYLWRNVIPHLSAQGRCIAIDHIGMGKSDQPDIEYGFETAANYLEGFIDSLNLKNITLVIHDWGGILGFDYANRHRDNIKAIAFMEASIDVPRFETMPTSVKIALRMMRSKFIGSFMVKNMNIMINKLLPDLINRELTEKELAHYAAPFPTKESRAHLQEWPRNVPIKGKPEFSHNRIKAYASWLKESTLPKLCLFVTPGVGVQEEDIKIIQNEFKNTKLVFLGEGTHFIQEDYPHEIGTEISKWMTNQNL